MTTTSTTIDDFLDHVDEVGLFPGAAMKILNLSRSRSATLDDLEDVVAMDSVLAGRVLKVANSPLLGRRTRIGTLRHAVQMLGFAGTRDISLALAVSGVTQRDSPLGRYLWQHAEVTAWTARTIARHVRRSDPDALFVAGLLHDLGMQLLLAIEPRRTADLMEQFDPHSALILKAETLHHGFTHAQLGAACLRRWRLPEFAAQLVEHHHEPVLEAAGAADPRSHAMLQIADSVAPLLVAGESAHTMAQAASEHPCRETLHMTEASMERAFTALTDHRDELLAEED